MPDPATTPSRAIDRVQPQRDQLREAHLGLARACDMSDVSREMLIDGLDLLRAAFEVHVAYAEGEGGLFEELLDDAPTEAAPEVDRLKRDHQVIASTIGRASGLLTEGAGPSDDRLVDVTTELLRLVAQHRRRGAELLYNVYGVDTGAGD
ncbi:MAG TPA: hypothetical protein VEP49_03135 [Acidimicrobiia bacterium]|nr:hypothetical protein [Acidimicrobiia bacterium]